MLYKKIKTQYIDYQLDLKIQNTHYMTIIGYNLPLTALLGILMKKLVIKGKDRQAACSDFKRGLERAEALIAKTPEEEASINDIKEILKRTLNQFENAEPLKTSKNSDLPPGKEIGPKKSKKRHDKKLGARKGTKEPTTGASPNLTGLRCFESLNWIITPIG